jgi:hypothetical protein
MESRVSHPAYLFVPSATTVTLVLCPTMVTDPGVAFGFTPPCTRGAHELSAYANSSFVEFNRSDGHSPCVCLGCFMFAYWRDAGQHDEHNHTGLAWATPAIDQFTMTRFPSSRPVFHIRYVERKECLACLHRFVCGNVVGEVGLSLDVHTQHVRSPRLRPWGGSMVVEPPDLVTDHAVAAFWPWHLATKETLVCHDATWRPARPPVGDASDRFADAAAALDAVALYQDDKRLRAQFRGIMPRLLVALTREYRANTSVEWDRLQENVLGVAWLGSERFMVNFVLDMWSPFVDVGDSRDVDARQLHAAIAFLSRGLPAIQSADARLASLLDRTARAGPVAATAAFVARVAAECVEARVLAHGFVAQALVHAAGPASMLRARTPSPLGNIRDRPFRLLPAHPYATDELAALLDIPGLCTLASREIGGYDEPEHRLVFTRKPWLVAQYGTTLSNAGRPVRYDTRTRPVRRRECELRMLFKARITVDPPEDAAVVRDASPLRIDFPTQWCSMPAPCVLAVLTLTPAQLRVARPAMVCTCEAVQRPCAKAQQYANRQNELTRSLLLAHCRAICEP